MVNNVFSGDFKNMLAFWVFNCLLHSLILIYSMLFCFIYYELQVDKIACYYLSGKREEKT